MGTDASRHSIGWRASVFVGLTATGLLIGWSAYWPLVAMPALRLALPAVFLGLAAAAYLVENLRAWRPAALALFSVSLGFALTYLAGGLPVRWLGWSTATPAGVTAIKAGEIVPVVAVILVLAATTKNGLPSLGLRRGRLGIGLLLSLVPLACLVGFFWTLGGFRGLGMLPPGTFASWLPWLIGFSALNGFMEELWFRGLWLDRFAGLLGSGASLAVTTIVFTVMHVSVYWGNPALYLMQMAVAWTVLGICCGWIRLRSGTLWPAVLVHALYDFAYMIKYFSEL